MVVASSSWYLSAVNWLGPAAALVVAVVGVLIAVDVFRRDRRVTSRESIPQKTLENRLEELSKSMRNSARLVEQVSAELDARAATAKKLQEEAAAAQALADMNKAQGEAIRHLIDTELEGSERRIRRDAIVIGIGSFVAGGGVSFCVTLLVHPLH